MDIDAYILIGGHSSRLGLDKAFLEFDGKTLADRMAETVNKAFAPLRINFVAAKKEQFDTDLINRLSQTTIFDLKPGFGAWSGIQTALSDTRSEWVFVTACDYPMVSTELLRLIAAQISDENDAVVPRQIDGRLQPLCAFYRVDSMLPEVNSKLTASDKLPSLMSFLNEAKTRIVEKEEYCELENSDRFFLNINTADDLSALSPDALE